MNPEDEAAFDAAEADRGKTFDTAAVVAHVEAVAKTTAQGLWAIGKPVLQAGGQALITALATAAAGALEGELTRLAEGKK